MRTSEKNENRFATDASRYAAYLETPEGRLRRDLAFANLQDFLPALDLQSLHALDLGGGTGTASVRLARLGMQVTLLDSSPTMLELAQQTIRQAGVDANVTIKEGDVAQLAGIFEARSFDIILCHNVLEYLDCPVAILRGAVRLMRDSSAILSLLVRNQAGEVLKAALQTGDLDAAEQNLAAEWGHESLYGGKVRLFTPETLEGMLKDASLAVTARSGVRIIADYLPVQISRSAEYERIFALERKLGVRRDCFGVARYLHCLAQRVTAAAEVDE